MERRIIDLKNEKKYNEVLRLASSLTPDACTNSEVAHAVGKAYEKKNGFSQCIPWYIRSILSRSTVNSVTVWPRRSWQSPSVCRRKMS